jgi:hypothetical protein
VRFGYFGGSRARGARVSEPVGAHPSSRAFGRPARRSASVRTPEPSLVTRSEERPCPRGRGRLDDCLDRLQGVSRERTRSWRSRLTWPCFPTAC